MIILQSFNKRFRLGKPFHPERTKHMINLKSGHIILGLSNGLAQVSFKT